MQPSKSWPSKCLETKSERKKIVKKKLTESSSATPSPQELESEGKL